MNKTEKLQQAQLIEPSVKSIHIVVAGEWKNSPINMNLIVSIDKYIHNNGYGQEYPCIKFRTINDQVLDWRYTEIRYDKGVSHRDKDYDMIMNIFRVKK